MNKSRNLIDYLTMIGMDTKSLEFFQQKSSNSPILEPYLFLDKIEIISCIIPEDKTIFNKPEEKWLNNKGLMLMDHKSSIFTVFTLRLIILSLILTSIKFPIMLQKN